uniref:Dolichyl-diphosphooligosaccharide--protein glycosyltransferase subunit DAD1 n=1 Tax=Sinocyclocheilus grahami TaxID=75366 RepID=A0A672T884_SINGR
MTLRFKGEFEFRAFERPLEEEALLIDAYLLYIMMTGALQFISQHVSFQQLFFWFHIVLCLRVQINPQNKVESLSISPERAFADFQFAHTVLHLVVINFIG